MKGFPVVSSDGRNSLEGYLGRNEIEYVLSNKPRGFDEFILSIFQGKCAAIVI